MGIYQEAVLENGCVNKETLEVFKALYRNPHVIYCNMYLDEESECEKVMVSFVHYSQMMLVHFNTETKVGEVYTEVPDTSAVFSEGEVNYTMEHGGIITLDNLGKLFDSLPHINNFVEKPEGQTLH